jgi:MFS family permease
MSPAGVIAGGLALVGAGSAVAAASLTATSVIAWGVLAGVGVGSASVAATTLGASAVGDADRGTVAGLLGTAAQVGTALGVAALVLVAGAAADYRLGLAVAAAVAALGVAVQAILLASPAGHAGRGHHVRAQVARPRPSGDGDAAGPAGSVGDAARPPSRQDRTHGRSVTPGTGPTSVSSSVTSGAKCR